MKKNLSFLQLLFFALIMVSCVPTQTLVDTSCVGYKSNDFVRNDIATKGIGIMPVLGGAEREQFRRPMGDAISKYMKTYFGTDAVKSPNEVITLINNNNLSDAYTTTINNYTISGIVPKEMVINLGKTLSVNYLLYTRLLSDVEVQTLYTGYSTMSTSITEIFVQCQVWDTRLGDVVWEGKGGTAKLDRDLTDVVEKTADGLSKVIGLDKNQGPCENMKDLITSQQKAMVNSAITISVVSLVLTLILLALI
jgi:hypothetical protein